MSPQRSVLLGPAALASAALVVVNDAWLKRAHPGLVSGKLSDVGLCILLPLVLLAALEEVPGRRARARTRHLVALAVALGYFVLVKTVPAATHLHVAALGALVPGVRFRAVTDPTDLVCLPAAFVALRTMRARDRAQGSMASTRSIFSRLGGFAMWRTKPASLARARSSGSA